MQNLLWKNYFDVVFLPPKEIAEYTIRLSKDFSRYGTQWALGKKSFIPHISLYHIPVKHKNFNDFAGTIAQIIQNAPVGHLTTKTTENNLLKFDKPRWIQKLYMKIIKNTVQYFDWDYGAQDLWPLYEFSNTFQKTGVLFIKKYGTPFVGRNFLPHITLTQFKKQQPKLKTRKIKKFSFKPRYIYICELGISHSCQKIVKKIPFC